MYFFDKDSFLFLELNWVQLNLIAVAYFSLPKDLICILNLWKYNFERIYAALRCWTENLLTN